MLLLDIQKAIQFKETLQNMFCTHESANLNREETGNLRYHKRCNEAYSQALTIDTFQSRKRCILTILHLGYQSSCCLRLYRCQPAVFHFIGAIEYIHWDK
jgi:hypothetical protein